MQLRQIEVFHAVMITGSTVAAAQALNVTQPAVSTTLKRMQDEMGLALFRTLKGRLVPTPEAHALFGQVRAIHEDLDQLRRLARTLAEGRIGFIRFGAVPAVSEGVAARAIAALRKDAPDVQIAMEVLNSHELVHRLQAGRLDLACVFGDHDDLPLTVLDRREIALLCIGPLAYLGGRTSMSLADLRGFPLAAMRPTDPIGRLFAKACRDQGVALDPVVELRSCRAAVALARQGVTVGIADDLSLADADIGTALAVPFDPPLNIEMTVCTLAGHVPSTAELRFAKLLTGSIETHLRTEAPALRPRA